MLHACIAPPQCLSLALLLSLHHHDCPDHRAPSLPLVLVRASHFCRTHSLPLLQPHHWLPACMRSNFPTSWTCWMCFNQTWASSFSCLMRCARHEPCVCHTHPGLPRDTRSCNAFEPRYPEGLVVETTLWWSTNPTTKLAQFPLGHLKESAATIPAACACESTCPTHVCCLLSPIHTYLSWSSFVEVLSPCITVSPWYLCRVVLVRAAACALGYHCRPSVLRTTAGTMAPRLSMDWMTRSRR